MATVTTRLASSRINFNGNINVNSGRLGINTIVTSSSSFNLLPGTDASRYFSLYDIEFTSSVIGYLITLPPISSTGVSFGWKARIFAKVPILATGIGSSQTINILSSSSTNLYIFNCITNGGASSTTNTAITFTVTAIGPGTGDWLIEAEEAYFTEPTATIIYNPNSSNSLQLRQFPSISKLYFISNNTTNVNVLFSAAVPIVFTSVVTPRNSYDLQYYSFMSANSVITFIAAGSYYFELSVRLTSAGGATTTNCQFQARINGTTNVAAFSIRQTTFSSAEYLLRGFVTVNAGDFIQIFGGRTATTGGTLTVNGSTVLNINCCGI